MFEKQIAVFLTLCVTGSFTKTAERLFMSQGTVSKYIAFLEKKFGPLVKRNNNGVVVNEQGKLVFDYFIKMLDQEFQMKYELLQMEEAHPTITISTIPSIVNYHIFQVIKEFQKKYPAIEVRFQESSMRDWEKDISPEKIDFLFFHQMNERISLLNYEALAGEFEEFVVAVNRNNSLSTYPELHFKDLVNEKFFLLDWSTKKVDPILNVLKKDFAESQILYIGQNLDMILSSVSSNMGVSILLKRIIPDKETHQLKLVPFNDLEGGKVVLVRQRQVDHSRPANLFWEFVMTNQLVKSGIPKWNS
ncbi:LysR family transcriptional regulator [Lactobacillus sp. UCMA15818]|uniref:LysR family transcriptional regulator n=1 Tax=Lactobacillus sp. UCMA15818 TaxID=2583394 RepID=UPI0025B14E13|nr:LysR family transcriptional regulator [Lactobacillus sp. UCMA15818]MDN2452203.1 LysR family transcriptional regulator [Lactobacillus sp. UCMA15818]